MGAPPVVVWSAKFRSNLQAASGAGRPGLCAPAAMKPGPGILARGGRLGRRLVRQQRVGERRPLPDDGVGSAFVGGGPGAGPFKIVN